MLTTEHQKIYSMPIRGCVNIQLNGGSLCHAHSAVQTTPHSRHHDHFRDSGSPVRPARSASFVGQPSCPIFKESPVSPVHTPRKRSTTIDIKTVKSLSEDKRRQIGSILRKDFDFRSPTSQDSSPPLSHAPFNADEPDEGVSSVDTPPASRAQLRLSPPLPTSPSGVVPSSPSNTYSPDSPMTPISLNDVRQCTAAAFKRQYSTKDTENDSAVGTSVNGDESLITDFESTIDGLSLNNSVRYVRAAFFKHKDISILLKISCSQKLEDKKLYDFMTSICEACKDLFKKKKTNVICLAAHELNKLKLFDRRPAKEHLSCLCRHLCDDVILEEAACQRSTKTFHVGTLVTNSLSKTSRCEIAEDIILVTLTSLNRIAPVQEFIDQLCQHIEVSRPSELGNPLDVPLGRRPQRLEKATKYQLLSQSFIHDSIISVAEAAHRSFLRIETFKHYV